jgi:hypothetical protein
MKWSWPLL